MKASSAASSHHLEPAASHDDSRNGQSARAVAETVALGEASVLSRVRQAQLAIDPTLPLEDVLHQIVAQGVALARAQSGAVWVPRGASPREPQSTPDANETDSSAWLCYALREALLESPNGAVFASTNHAAAKAAHLAPARLDDLSKAALRSAQVQSATTPSATMPSATTPSAQVQSATTPSDAQVSAHAATSATQDSSTGNLPPEYAAHEYSCAADIAFPLKSQGRVIGILRLRAQTDSPNEAPFDAACQSQLALFCEHAAAMVGQARVFQQLRNAKREWEVTFDGMLDGVCVERSDGAILRANRALASLLDLDVAQILGEKRPELLARLPNYQLLKPLQRDAQDASGLNVRNGEFRFGAPERIIAESVFSLRFLERRQRTREAGTREPRPREPRLDEADHGHLVCVLRDVTEQRRLQEHLLQSEKLAALGELVSGVAHELNNPLTTVVGYAQLLQDDSALSENVRRQMGVIHSEAARASRIVSNLLAFARREEPRKTRLDINETLRPVVQMRSYQLQSQGTHLIADYGTDLPPVWGDAHQLQQVLLNIINNAHQAMNTWRGSGEIRLTTQSVLINGAAGARISVSDDGPGIAPDHLRRLFDPFFTTKPMGEGTGLGMSISLGIVSNHEGRIWAESTLGHGALFVVELPAINAQNDAEADDFEGEHESDFVPTMRGLSTFGQPNEPTSQKTAAPAASQSITIEEPEENGARILVIDDEEPVVTLITEVLNLDGHEITPAFNGAEALALLQHNDYDLILSDVRMPAVGGPTFFESLQTTRPDLLPLVVFVTGDTVSTSTREFLKKTNRPMLAKPFDPERLRALVNEQLAANK